MSAFTLRLKLLLKDRTACICYLAASLVVLVLLLGLNLHAQERSSLPIGLMVEDDSEKAAELAENICASESLFVYEKDFDELYGMLLDGYINCIFVIKEGYGKNIRAGMVNDLLYIYAAEDDKISTIISDIVAGCMMDEVCLDKAYLRYMKLDASPEGAEKLDYAAYSDYVSSMAEDDLFSFVFDVQYMDMKTGELKATDITNGMIYRQMIAGMLAMLLMLICFCSGNGIAAEGENGIRRRLKTISHGYVASGIEEIAAILVYSLPISLLIAAMFYRQAGVLAFVRLVLLNLIFAAASAAVFYLFALLLKGVFAYQLLGTVTVIAFGVMGFVSVFEGLLGTSMFGFTPVAIYINRFLNVVG